MKRVGDGIVGGGGGKKILNTGVSGEELGRQAILMMTGVEGRGQRVEAGTERACP